MNTYTYADCIGHWDREVEEKPFWPPLFGNNSILGVSESVTPTNNQFSPLKIDTNGLVIGSNGEIVEQKKRDNLG